MNPPFSAAKAFITKALDAKIPVVCVLERLVWLATISDIARERQPSVLVLPNRASFVHKCITGPGEADYELVPYDLPSPEGTIKRVASSDASEYAWFVWEPSNASRVVILPDTPLAERKEGSWGYTPKGAAA